MSFHESLDIKNRQGGVCCTETENISSQEKGH